MLPRRFADFEFYSKFGMFCWRFLNKLIDRQLLPMDACYRELCIGVAHSNHVTTNRRLTLWQAPGE